MNRELVCVGAAVIGLVAGAGALAATPEAAPNKPGSDKVCVPGENGKGWVCGTRDNPPQVAPGATPPAERAAQTPQPPPFLANPNRRYNAPPATIERPAETQALADDAPPPVQEMPAANSTPPAPAETAGKAKGKGKDKGHATGARTAAAPTVTPAPAAAPAPVASASEAVPQPAQASNERATVESLPEPAPSAAPAAPAVVAAPTEPPATSTAAAPEPAPVVAPEPPPAPATPAAEPASPAAARRAAPASELPDGGYVIQLARGTSNHGFEQLRGKLKLDRQHAPEIRVGSAAAPEHVLLWSGFPDSKSAQAALSKLPKGTAPGAWVRSVESLRPLLVDAEAARPAASTHVAVAEPTPAAPTRSPDRSEPPAPAVAPAPVAEAPAATPTGSARAATLSNTTVAAFAALPGGHYAVQLARAHSTAGFARLVGTLGIPESSVYSVPVKTTGKLEYLLLWADFPNVEAARAAAARLPASAVQGALARRIGPLQEEARGAR